MKKSSRSFLLENFNSGSKCFESISGKTWKFNLFNFDHQVKFFLFFFHLTLKVKVKQVKFWLFWNE